MFTTPPFMTKPSPAEGFVVNDEERRFEAPRKGARG